MNLCGGEEWSVIVKEFNQLGCDMVSLSNLMPNNPYLDAETTHLA